MKFKVGDKVKTVSSIVSMHYKNKIGIIAKIDTNFIKPSSYAYFIECNPYCVKFSDVYAWFDGEQLEPYYSTHDILEEIICE